MDVNKLTFTSAAIVDPRTATLARRRGNRENPVLEITGVSITVLIAAGYAGYRIDRVANDAGILRRTA